MFIDPRSPILLQLALGWEESSIWMPFVFFFKVAWHTDIGWHAPRSFRKMFHDLMTVGQWTFGAVELHTKMFGRHTAGWKRSVGMICCDLLLSCRNSFVEKYAEESFWLETCQERLYFGQGVFIVVCQSFSVWPYGFRPFRNYCPWQLRCPCKVLCKAPSICVDLLRMASIRKRSSLHRYVCI